MVPEPNKEPPLTGARSPKVSLQVPGLVAEYRNQPVVAPPLGFAAPFRVTAVPVTFVALFVVTTGARAAVVNDRTEPKDVPIPLLAIAQK